jgi:cytochrome c553
MGHLLTWGQSHRVIGFASRCLIFALAAIADALPVPQSATAGESDWIAPEARTEAAIADFQEAMKLDADLRNGARLYSMCAACHGAGGLGTEDGSVPAIAGQHASVLVKQLVDFRHEGRWGEQMREIASKHNLGSPQELLDVASYAESLPRWPPLGGAASHEEKSNEGYVAYHRYCAECHGPLGLGDRRRAVPRLAGQRYQYLLRQLEETADRMRPGMDVEHIKRIGAFSSEERRALASHLSNLSSNFCSTTNKTH